MAINRTPNKDIEYYSDATEVLKEPDRVELDIAILGWDKKLRIRALSFGQMERINKMSTIMEADATSINRKIAGELDQEEWTYWTIKEGVVIPSFTISQARELADNNGTFVRELADEIWNLGRISKKMWDAYIEEQKRANSDIQTDV